MSYQFETIKNDSQNFQDLEIKQEQYQPIVYQEGFGFKNKIKLFKDGFKNGSKGLFTLFISYVLWLFVFAIIGMTMEYIFKTYWFSVQISEQKEFLEATNYKDYFVVFLLMLFVGLTYNSQQLFTLNNLFKIENIHQKNNFILIIKQLPLLVKTSVIFSLILMLFIYLLGLFLVKFFPDGKFELMNGYGILFTFIALMFVTIVYFFMLGNTLIYISSHLNPFKINILKKSWRSFKKVIKMFDLLIPTLILHVIILSISLMISTFVGETVYNYYMEKNKAFLNVEQLPDQSIYLYMTIIFVTLPLLSMFQTYFNRARLRSIALMFMLTEDQDDYCDRLTKPMKQNNVKK